MKVTKKKTKKEEKTFIPEGCKIVWFGGSTRNRFSVNRKAQ
jgi:hypothetical protein